MSNKEKDIKNMEEINIKMSEYAKKTCTEKKKKNFSFVQYKNDKNIFKIWWWITEKLTFNCFKYSIDIINSGI